MIETEDNLSCELEEQRPGNDRKTKISPAYIESAAFRKKFDRISTDANLNRLIYKIAKRILYHRSGTSYEDMYWIDLDSKRVIAKEVDSIVESKIVYSRKTHRIVSHTPGLLAIHSHPNSCPPSVDDFNWSFYNQYAIGIVVCHNGRLFKYSADQEISPGYFRLKVEKYQKIGYNEVDAQLEAIENIRENYDIYFEEVF